MLNSVNTVFPPDFTGVIDVTKPPYSVDNTGALDCTEKLIRIINDVMSEHVRDMEETYRELCKLPKGGHTSWENRVNDEGLVRAIFPNRINLTPIIYFPNGTYLVSDTVAYTLPNLHNMLYYYTSGGMEMNRCIRLVGQSEDKTVIKLKDNCKGFEFGQERCVISLMNGIQSNIAMSNYIMNMTVDVGSGNPGAVGIRFFGNNSGAVRNVTVRSSDPEHCGAIGIRVDREMHSSCNFYDITIDGFDYGIKHETFRTVSHFENVRFLNQRKYGCKITDTAIQFIGVESDNNVPAFYVAGPTAHFVLTDAVMRASDPTSDYSAIHHEGGVVYLRNVDVEGYPFGYDMRWREFTLATGHIEEYSSAPTFTLFDEKAEGIGLKVPHVPYIEPENDFSKWVSVNDFGAVGDGVTDDTEAISRAFASGKPIIWFQQGRYLIERPIEIPETVERIHFMFSDIVAGKELSLCGDSVFKIMGNCDKLLYIEDLFSWNECAGNIHMFSQYGDRNVFMRDMHTQGCAFYTARAKGAELHFENCACTVQDKESYGHIPCFSFWGQKVWCHSINPERSMVETENRGGQLWWSGFKTEQYGTVSVTTGGGVTEILGGIAVVGADCEYRPVITNRDSTVSAVLATSGYHDYSTFPVAVKESRGYVVRTLKGKDMPVRNAPFYYIPLYSGKKEKQ